MWGQKLLGKSTGCNGHSRLGQGRPSLLASLAGHLVHTLRLFMVSFQKHAGAAL